MCRRAVKQKSNQKILRCSFYFKLQKACIKCNVMFSGKHLVMWWRLRPLNDVEVHEYDTRPINRAFLFIKLGQLLFLNIILRYFIPKYHDMFAYLIEGNDYIDVCF